MNEFKLKEQICEIGRRLYNRGFAAANDGNITIRVNDREVLCTPTMVSKGFMKPEDVCKVDMEGKQLAGNRRRTSEVLLHLAVYKARPDVKAVVHCHPPHATAFAVAREPIPKCVLPEVEVFLGEVPIAAYATPGDQKFAETVLPFVKNCNTILLANHGTITFGPDLENAYFNSEIIDAYCRILILSKMLGRVNYFSDGQTRELLNLKKRLGLPDPRLDKPDCDICTTGVLGYGAAEMALEPFAFPPPSADHLMAVTPTPATLVDQVVAAVQAATKPKPAPKPDGHEALVQQITDAVLAALKKQAG